MNICSSHQSFPIRFHNEMIETHWEMLGKRPHVLEANCHPTHTSDKTPNKCTFPKRNLYITPPPTTHVGVYAQNHSQCLNPDPSILRFQILRSQTFRRKHTLLSALATSQLDMLFNNQKILWNKTQKTCQSSTSCWFQPIWKRLGKIESSPQLRVKIKQ